MKVEMNCERSRKRGKKRKYKKEGKPKEANELTDMLLEDLFLRGVLVRSDKDINFPSYLSSFSQGSEREGREGAEGEFGVNELIDMFEKLSLQKSWEPSGIHITPKPYSSER